MLLPALPPAPPPSVQLAPPTEALLDRGRDHLAAGRFEAAAFDFERLLRQHPRLAPAYWGLAWSWLKREQYGMALLPLAEATRLEPGYGLGWRELARCYYYMRRYERALAAIDRAIAHDAGDAEAWRLKGLVLHAAKADDQALMAFVAARSLDPADVLSARLLGALHLRAGRAAEAEGPLVAALAIEPHDSEAARLLHEAYWAQAKLGGVVGLWFSRFHVAEAADER